MNKSEKTDLKLGFIPLLDCAPLIIAREKGFFAEQGLNVTLCCEASWASIRDKVSFGLYDAAHMLAPMPLAATLGLNGNPCAMSTAISLSQNGIALTFSTALYNNIAAVNANGIGAQFFKWLQENKQKPVLATVYPYSNHHYLLRDWLGRQGIDCDNDLHLIAVPPVKMFNQLTEGFIDGFCVGEPWNSFSIEKQQGELVTTSHHLWDNHMEKVLGVTSEWAEKNPITHKAMITAIQKACTWCQLESNRAELYSLLSLPPYLDQAIAHLNSDAPFPMGLRFHGDNCNQPSPEQGKRILEQMNHAGQIGTVTTDHIKLLQQVFRSDLYQSWIN